MGAFDIQGINCVFQLKIDDLYKTVVCAKSFTFNPVTDMKETTTVGSGFWKEFRPRKLSYTITFNGMFQVLALNTQEKIKTMFDYQIGFLPLPYRLIFTDNSSNVMVVEGWIYVTSTLLDASPANLVNGTIELQGNGMPVISNVIPDLANINIISLGDHSISAVFQFKLFDSTGAIVFDSGQLPGASGGNLTHPVNVTGTVQKGTYSIFWQSQANSVGNAFQLDAPPTRSAVYNNSLTNENTYGIQDYDFTANRTVTFTLGVPAPPPGCVPPFFPGATTILPATIGTPWSSAFPISGSDPFTLSNITKPAWIIMEIVPLPGSYFVTMYGMPVGSSGTYDISFDLNNPCGTVHFAGSVVVSDASTDQPIINWDFSQLDTPSSGEMKIFINGAYSFSATSTQSGSFTVNPGDTVEVQVVGLGTVEKRLFVDNVTDSINLYTGTASLSIKTFSWATIGGKTYSIEAGSSDA
jgi:hypothetical protein